MTSSNPFTSAWDEAENEAPSNSHQINYEPYPDPYPSAKDVEAECFDSNKVASVMGCEEKAEDVVLVAPRFLGIWLCAAAVAVFLLHATSIEIEGWENKDLEWSSHFFTNEFVFYLLLLFTGCSILCRNAFQKPLVIAVLSSMIAIRFPQLICGAIFEVKEHLATQSGHSILDICKKSEITALLADGAELMGIIISSVLIGITLVKNTRMKFENEKKEITICTTVSLSAFFMVLPGTTYTGMLATSMSNMICWEHNPSADLLGSFTGISGNSVFGYFTIFIGILMAYPPKLDCRTLNSLKLFGLMFFFGLIFIGQLMVVINGCYVIHEIHTTLKTTTFGSCVFPFVYVTFAEKIISWLLIGVSACLIIKWTRKA